LLLTRDEARRIASNIRAFFANATYEPVCFAHCDVGHRAMAQNMLRECNGYVRSDRPFGKWSEK